MRARVGLFIACGAVSAPGVACRDRDAAPPARTEVVWASNDAAEPTAPAAGADARARKALGPPFVGTAGITTRDASVSAAALLRDVRAARHPGYDRVVFEFSEQLPNYRVEYIDKPVRQCGSGDPTAIAGDAWLEVEMIPAHAHDDNGAPTIRDRERHDALGVLRELEQTCDFEAHVTWVLGVASPNRYRVLELDSPWRIVVDIRH